MTVPRNQVLLGDCLATYTVSTWDHEAEAWTPTHRSVSKWGIRKALRELYGSGWSSVSVMVVRDTEAGA